MISEKIIGPTTTLLAILKAMKTKLDFLPLLSLRLYLAPIFIAVGLHKFHNIESIISWFGNSEWGLGLPAPALMAYLAASAELFGGIALLLGVATRLATIPLIFTMIVAASTAHWDNGWFAIAPSDPETSVAKILAPIGFPGAADSLENSEAVGKRLSAAKSLLREHGNFGWLTEKGGIVILNNGIEFAMTYLIMLITLLAFGPGRFISIDYWLVEKTPLKVLLK